MKSPFSEYEVYVFDLDGTLYDQPKLRKIMAARLMKYYLLRPFMIFDLYKIYRFRKIKDNWDKYEKISFVTEPEKGAEAAFEPLGDLDIRVCEYMAKGKAVKKEKLCKLIFKWIYDNPITALSETSDRRLSEIIGNLRNAGKTVVIFSDYPVEDKLKALGIEADKNFCSADERIGEYKPSSKGLEVIASDYGVDKSKLLMIGDRQEKDGMCAENFGADYLILDRDVSKRNYDLFKI